MALGLSRRRLPLVHVFVAVLCLSCAGVHQRIGDTPRRVFVAVADDSMDAKPEDADADAWIEEEARSLGLDDMSEATMSKLFQWAIGTHDDAGIRIVQTREILNI